MYAGLTKLPVGTRTRITRIAGADAREDHALVGRTGVLVQPFTDLMKPGVEYLAGVELDDLTEYMDDRINLTIDDGFDLVAR
jgi:hypothetical protein